MVSLSDWDYFTLFLQKRIDEPSSSSYRPSKPRVALVLLFGSWSHDFAQRRLLQAFA